MNILEISLLSTDVKALEKLSKSEINLPEVTVVSQYLNKPRGDELLGVYQIILQLSLGVASSLIASWLYDLIKASKAKLEINRKEVQLSSPEELEKILRDTISPTTTDTPEKEQ